MSDMVSVRKANLVRFGFASYADGHFELIVRNADDEETTLRGQLQEGQLEVVDRILPTCVFVDGVPAETMKARSIVYSLGGAKEWFLAHRNGSLCCVRGARERVVQSYPEAKEFYGSPA